MAEGVDGTGSTESKDSAGMTLLTEGYVVLDDVVAVEKLRNVDRQLRQTHARYFDETFLAGAEDVLCVGDKRYFFNPRLTGALAEPDIFANPRVMTMVRSILGQDAIIESLGVINSFPGSRMQHIHRDGGRLYDIGLANLLPPYALTVAMPLVEMNELSGTTAFWPGSHLKEERQDDMTRAIAPLIRVGSCGVWDYRVCHAGLPNKSDRVRPLLYIVYARSWFRDTRNFRKRNQRRISFDDGFLENLAEKDWPLFTHLACREDGV
jgi:ectoine hydroxylase-related dioxygenase (phytanoyl-CoA dioxygenase family)